VIGQSVGYWKQYISLLKVFYSRPLVKKLSVSVKITKSLDAKKLNMKL